MLIVNDDNILDGRLQPIKKTDALVFASTETGIDVNIDKVKNKIQNEGRIHNIYIDNISSYRLECIKLF